MSPPRRGLRVSLADICAKSSANTCVHAVMTCRSSKSEWAASIAIWTEVLRKQAKTKGVERCVWKQSRSVHCNLPTQPCWFVKKRCRSASSSKATQKTATGISLEFSKRQPASPMIHLLRFKIICDASWTIFDCERWISTPSATSSQQTNQLPINLAHGIS